MALLIDTSAFVTLERRGQGPSLLNLAAPGEPAAVATITVSELLVGAHRANTTARRLQREALVERIVAALVVVPFDLDAARVHARISADLATAGSMIGAHDLIIAATALAHGYGVLTENLREFRRVPGLAVRQPGW